MAVAVTCQEDSSITPTNASVGYGFTASTYVREIRISNSCSEPWIVIYTQNTGTATDVVLSLDGYISETTGRIVWNCHQVNGEDRHLPRSCRDHHW